MTEPALPSTAATRWFLPLFIIWAGLLLSAWVYMNRIPEALREDGGLRLLATLVAVPLFALGVLFVLRTVGRIKQRASRSGDVLVLWVMAFLFAVHASVLAVAIQMIERLDQAIPAATGLLMFGMGPVVHTLEPFSAMGIRTKATLSSERVWRRTHHLAGKLFMASGVIGLLGLLFEGAAMVAVAIAPAALTLVISVIYAQRIASRAPDGEQMPPEERPTDDATSP